MNIKKIISDKSEIVILLIFIYDTNHYSTCLAVKGRYSDLFCVFQAKNKIQIYL